MIDKALRPWMPGYTLYHGTNLIQIPSIAQHGIEPRKDRKGNWEHSVKAHKERVYLTNAYALYYAQSACLDHYSADAAVVLELEGRDVYSMCCADEDAVEQMTRGRDPEPRNSWDVKRRTIYYRSRSHLIAAAPSLDVLGTCAYKGTVHPSLVRRCAVLSQATVKELVLVGGIDPFVSIENYQIMGALYREFHDWLFNGKGPWETAMLPEVREVMAALGKKPATVDREGILVMSLHECAVLARKTFERWSQEQREKEEQR